MPSDSSKSVSFEKKYILLFWIVFLFVEITKKSILFTNTGYILFFYLPGFILWILLTAPIVKIFIWSSKFKEVKRIPILFLLAIATGVIKNILNWSIFYQLTSLIGDSTKTFGEFFSSNTSFYYVEASIIAAVTIILLFMWELYQRYQLKSIQAASLESQLMQAELQALKMQLQPHFLFNAHHTISMLVRTKKYEQAVDMIAALSDLLRSSFNRPGTQLITLKEELDLLQKYLFIEQIRFEDSLNITIDVPTATMSFEVPNFLLQPIVENAFKHGISKFVGNAILSIKADLSNEFLTLSVENSGPPLPESFSINKSRGIGLSNTMNRLKQIYKRDGLLCISSTNNCVTVKLQIPV